MDEVGVFYNLPKGVPSPQPFYHIRTQPESTIYEAENLPSHLSPEAALIGLPSLKAHGQYISVVVNHPSQGILLCYLQKCLLSPQWRL